MTQYCISGVKVKFPHNAYSVQVAMMEKIIKSLQRSENCIVENPTGCGKSLSLLCSSLAWQAAKNESLDQDNKEEDCVCICHDYCPTPVVKTTIDESDSLNTFDGGDDDFKESMKIVNKQKSAKSKHRSHESPPREMSSDDDEPKCDDCFCWDTERNENLKRKRMPKIFFSSRTHKQLGQVIRELRKTVYKDVRMTILSSRDFTCIHPRVRNEPNKGDECRELREYKACKYFKRSDQYSHKELKKHDVRDAWDIEDIVKFGQKFQGCAYFGARTLMKGADIVFCPYNYLIDPIIRNSMEIDLKNNVVILDEAHNIEDVSRDAVSHTVTSLQLDDAILNFRMLQRSLRERRKYEPKGSKYAQMEEMCLSLKSMIDDNSSALDTEGGFDSSSKIWSGGDLLAQLELNGLGQPEVEKYGSIFASLVSEEPKSEKEEREESMLRAVEKKMLSSTACMMEAVFVVMNFMFKDSRKYFNDYRLVLTREFGESSSKYESNGNNNEVWLSKKGKMKSKSIWIYKLNFWCMNSAVAFLNMSEGTRSVVLTSGTLSPMTSFQSELGLPFHTHLECRHVIDLKQVSVHGISSGPRRVNLLGTYQNSERWDYQDEVGETLLRICQTVPYGVLCFMSSYKALDKLCARWETTELMTKLKALKHIFIEPKSSNKMEFEKAMTSYYESIDGCKNNGPDDVSGALFLAVCRGKVSEGMDFADDYARAVVLVGIPYPNVKDVQVNLKKTYNDAKITNGLLSGRDWYEVQAFRALNQALGRCIRHKNDWGAILLVDERFSKNSKKNLSYFSKWIREKIQFQNNFDHVISDLQNFMVSQTSSKANEKTIQSNDE